MSSPSELASKAEYTANASFSSLNFPLPVNSFAVSFRSLFKSIDKNIALASSVITRFSMYSFSETNPSKLESDALKIPALDEGVR